MLHQYKIVTPTAEVAKWLHLYQVPAHGNFLNIRPKSRPLLHGILLLLRSMAIAGNICQTPRNAPGAGKRAIAIKPVRKTTGQNTNWSAKRTHMDHEPMTIVISQIWVDISVVYYYYCILHTEIIIVGRFDSLCIHGWSGRLRNRSARTPSLAS